MAPVVLSTPRAMSCHCRRRVFSTQVPVFHLVYVPAAQRASEHDDASGAQPTFLNFNASPVSFLVPPPSLPLDAISWRLVLPRIRASSPKCSAPLRTKPHGPPTRLRTMSMRRSLCLAAGLAAVAAQGIPGECLNDYDSMCVGRAPGAVARKRATPVAVARVACCNARSGPAWHRDCVHARHCVHAVALRPPRTPTRVHCTRTTASCTLTRSSRRRGRSTSRRCATTRRTTSR